MVFYELGNGCDSCETLPSNSNINMLEQNSFSPGSSMGSVMGSSMGSSMGMPYGTQNNVQKQYNNSGMQSSYGGAQVTQQYQQPTQQQAQQTNQPTMMLVPATTVSTTTTSNGQIVKQVTVPNTVAIPSPNSVPATIKNALAVNEGFTDGTMATQQHNSKMWIVLGLVIFSALAGNECCKYFLNKSLQLNDGSPMYYVAYLCVAILLAYASYTYSSKL